MGIVDFPGNGLLLHLLMTCILLLAWPLGTLGSDNPLLFSVAEFPVHRHKLDYMYMPMCVHTEAHTPNSTARDIGLLYTTALQVFRMLNSLRLATQHLYLPSKRRSKKKKNWEGINT